MKISISLLIDWFAMAEVSSFLFYRLVFVPNETVVEHKLVVFKIGNSINTEVDFTVFL